MSNKTSSINASRLLDNKLAVILENFNKESKDLGIIEREAALLEFNKAINSFYKTLNNPLFMPEFFSGGTFPNYKKVNRNFQEISKDLDIIYREINSLEKFIVNNFNTLNTQGSALRGRLRRISSDLGDFRLQSTDNLGGATYFGDNFQSTEKIDYKESLYSEEKCSLDIRSGILSLPIRENGTKTYKVKEISIGSGSNGFIGNNQELGAILRGELKSLTDNNSDTWFEYESVSRESSSIPLILEAKFELEKESIINNFSFSATAFATRNYPRITKLEVSTDGKAFTDILGTIPTAVFFKGTKEKVLVMDPASGKFSGVTKVKTQPVKAKYVNIVFQQDDAYIVKTSSGIRYRKAIGLKQVEVSGEKYNSKGEIVSTLFSLDNEIKKVAVISDEDKRNGLTSVRHFVSVDDGQNWNELQSIDKISKDTKEILSFNLEGIDSIKTNTPASGIRHKALLERVSSGFSSRGGTEKRRESKVDFKNISGEVQSVSLSERPIRSSVSIKNISYGSVGRSEEYLVKESEKVERDNFSFIYLPEDPFKKGSIFTDQERIRIKNESWIRTLDLSSESGSAKVYEFDYLNNIIKFGDGTTGKKIDGDMFLSLDREQVQIINDIPKKIKTTFTGDEVKETTSIYRLGETLLKSGHVVAKAASVLRLNLEEIESLGIISDPGNIFLSEKTFNNGAVELLVDGDYSVDYKKGIIYSFKETPEEDDTILDISYRQKIEVKDFSFSDGDIIIPEKEYVTEETSETIVLGTPTKVIHLASGYIEPRSFRFLSLPGSFKTEVPFKGDGTEFELGLSSSELDGYYFVDYLKGIIYTYSQVSGSLVLEYNKTSFFAEYNLAVKVPRTDFTVNEEEQILTFSDQYVVRNFSDSLNRRLSRSLFKIDYDFIVELEQNPKELEAYSSPLLNGYALTILTKDQV